MWYELKKALSNRYAVLLLFAAVFLNALLFYSHCMDDSAGYTLLQVKEKYTLTETELSSEIEYLSDRAAEAVLSGSYLDNNLLTRNIFYEKALDQAVLQRKQEAVAYADYLQTLQVESAFKINSGLFGDKSSFSALSQLLLLKSYQKLNSIVPEVSFSGGLEVFSGWRLSDLILLLFGLVSSLLLLIQERRNGLLALLISTKRGHTPLYFKKLAAATMLLFVGFLLTYGIDLAVSAQLFGLGNLSRPIQSVYGFRDCPLMLTVAEYCLFFFAFKFLWSWCVCALFFCLCCIATRPLSVMLCAAGVLAAAIGLGDAGSLWLSSFSLVKIAATEQLYQRFVVLNLFGVPVKQLPVCILFCWLILLSSVFVGWFAFCKRPVIAATEKKYRFSLQLLYKHTALFLHEGYKIYVTGGALLVLALFAVLQIISYHDFKAAESEWEYYYHSYSTQLSGPRSETADAFLESEQERFAAIHKQIDAFYELADGDEQTAELLTHELRNSLRSENAFQAAFEQYDNLTEGQSYVYKSGYERLLGEEGQRDDLINTIKMIFVLILSFSGVFAAEQETGMRVLQTTIGASGRVARRKIVHSGCVILAVAAIAYVPQYIVISAHFGLPQLDAIANSLQILRWFSDAWTIRGTLILIGVIRLAIGAMTTAVILALSRKTGSTVVTMLLAAGILVIPFLAVLLIIF